MDLDTFKPTFLIQIEGQDLSKDITQEITSFVFTDNEEELDVPELSVTDRNLQGAPLIIGPSDPLIPACQMEAARTPTPAIRLHIQPHSEVVRPPAAHS